MQRQLHKIFKDHFKDKVQILLLVGLLIVGFVLIFGEQSNRSPREEKSVSQMPDTYIPKGFTLVPLELQNAESIASMIDGYAIVDLYSQSLVSKKAKKIGSQLRLLRAPLNPDKFAVLVPDSQAELVLGADGPISASILNRQLAGQGNLQTHPKIQKTKVEYYQEGT